MCKAFYYKKYDFNPEKGVLSLNFQIDDQHFFEEKILFPGAPFSLSGEQSAILEQIFFLTHIAFGISYFKTFCPENIIVESGQLSYDEAVFFEKFYLNGLGEFAVRNRLNLQDKIHFPAYEKTYNLPQLELDDAFLVPVGGGKDSCLTVEILKRMGKKISTISVGFPQAIENVVNKTCLPHITIQRQIAPYLIQLNQQPNVYNGHVPITGMLAFVLWASSVLYGYGAVAMSCESSANSGNMMQGSLTINHQYSKSFDFEKDFFEITQNLTPNFLYFSLLRPFKEIKIAELFSRFCSTYFDTFTSCNKAFKLDKTQRLNGWCGACDKCRFVFLVLAPFMPKNILIQSIGRNLLDDENQLSGFKELLGLEGFKPFECVGEVKECVYALSLLSQNPDWQNDYIVKELSPFIQQKEVDAPLLDEKHLIPKEIYNEMARIIA